VERVAVFAQGGGITAPKHDATVRLERHNEVVTVTADCY
jgi:hypothetical protein